MRKLTHSGTPVGFGLFFFNILNFHEYQFSWVRFHSYERFTHKSVLLDKPHRPNVFNNWARIHFTTKVRFFLTQFSPSCDTDHANKITSWLICYNWDRSAIWRLCCLPTLFPVLLDVSKCCAPISVEDRGWCCDSCSLQRQYQSAWIGKYSDADAVRHERTFHKVLYVVVVDLPCAPVAFHEVVLGAAQIDLTVL